MESLVSHLLGQPILDPDREQRLARAARSGDRAAHDALVRESLRLVALRAWNLGHRDDAFDEAVQAGTLGLIAAVRRFDPDRGCRLATYAWPWITAAMRVTVSAEQPSDRLDETPADPVSEPLDDVEVLLDRLPGDLARVLRDRYRIGEDVRSLRPRHEVAARLGLTPAQVREAEVRAMRHLRVRLAKVCHRAPRRGADPP